ncbi:GNAT family N-acetyltransferase [Rhodococcus sp. IEGM 1379]|uniref:GNAT family N-acetyltransferase n=1 Tax=Rhodococcus sp. IEGM 1379 TaxID=3047086 RepID=UPI0024B6F711|nr:GNAT family N-acetyltransferase [Rhodococcus sp. IEGM 1379]MDI9918896.1 GNAT family N-acetyltransferase [Rhodococcus sp. IEGM 1379]
MSTHTITSLRLDGLDQLSSHARRCVFWEMDPAALHAARGFCDQEFEKEAWLSMVLLEWGSCGQVAVKDGKPLGSALYAPPRSIPRAQMFPTSPVGSDAVLLTSLRLEPSGEEESLGPALISAVVNDLVRRGVRALEAFGIRGEPQQQFEGVASATAALECSPEECMISADFLEDCGFEVVAPHHRYPRLRLELNRDHEWKVDVEEALDRLLQSAALEMIQAGELTRV